MRTVAVVMLVAAAAWSAPPRAPRDAKGRAPAPVAPPPPRAPAAVDPALSSPELLKRAQGLYEALEYDQVVPVAEAVLARQDLTIDQRLEAYRLLGSARAIVEDPLEAEKPFRLLLRARTDYELPPGTAPKILAVFRKVQTEEQALERTLREVERARIVSGLHLLGEPPKEARGGKALKLAFRLKDPTGAVDTVRVPYRRAGQKDFSTLALQRADTGDWQGAIPAEFTADEHGFTLEYFVETADPKGALLTLGTAQAPRSLPVLPGLVVTPRARPVPRWVFVGAAALAATAGAAWGASGLAFNQAQARYTQGASAGVSGAELYQQQQAGELYARLANGAGVGFGVLAVTTLVLWPFTRFSDEAQD